MERFSLCPHCTTCPEIVVEGDTVRIGEREYGRPEEGRVERPGGPDPLRSTRPRLTHRSGVRAPARTRINLVPRHIRSSVTEAFRAASVAPSADSALYPLHHHRRFQALREVL